MASVRQFNAQRRGKHKLVAILDCHSQTLRRIVRVDVGCGCDGEIELPIVEVPSAPKVAEVFATLGLHRAEEVGWAWMFVRPLANKLAERKVEALRSENVITQEHEAECRLEVRDGVAIGLADSVGARHDWRRFGVG